jgi:hypothetical protein
MDFVWRSPNGVLKFKIFTCSEGLPRFMPPEYFECRSTTMLEF